MADAATTRMMNEALGVIEAEHAALAAILGSYSAAYLNHMNAEERWILPSARMHLTPEDRAAIHVVFCNAPDPLTVKDAQATFARLFNEIAQLAPPPIGVG